MRRSRMRGSIVWIALAIAAGALFYQLYGLVHANTGGRDATRLLYQVSLFQMELLNSSLNAAGSAQNTDQLDLVKQTVYAANYAHERLVLALGEERLNDLSSLTQLMQYILRLQVGGQRALKPDEQQTLQDAGKLCSQMYEAYGKLLTSSDAVVSSQSAKLAKLDGEMSSLLKKKLLQ